MWMETEKHGLYISIPIVLFGKLNIAVTVHLGKLTTTTMILVTVKKLMAGMLKISRQRAQ
jgi:hypothetical protein